MRKREELKMDSILEHARRVLQLDKLHDDVEILHKPIVASARRATCRIIGPHQEWVDAANAMDPRAIEKFKGEMTKQLETHLYPLPRRGRRGIVRPFFDVFSPTEKKRLLSRNMLLNFRVAQVGIERKRIIQQGAKFSYQGLSRRKHEAEVEILTRTYQELTAVGLPDWWNGDLLNSFRCQVEQDDRALKPERYSDMFLQPRVVHPYDLYFELRYLVRIALRRSRVDQFIFDVTSVIASMRNGEHRKKLDPTPDAVRSQASNGRERLHNNYERQTGREWGHQTKADGHA